MVRLIQALAWFFAKSRIVVMVMPSSPGMPPPRQHFGKT